MIVGCKDKRKFGRPRNSTKLVQKAWPVTTTTATSTTTTATTTTTTTATATTTNIHSRTSAKSPTGLHAIAHALGRKLPQPKQIAQDKNVIRATPPVVRNINGPENYHAGGNNVHHKAAMPWRVFFHGRPFTRNKSMNNVVSHSVRQVADLERVELLAAKPTGGWMDPWNCKSTLGSPREGWVTSLGGGPSGWCML